MNDRAYSNIEEPCTVGSIVKQGFTTQSYFT